ncbi:hypothetical protein [Streptomyces sp. NPDC088785]|uniref:hypothetical protein n=1 Tax=Streptomyces sp. NPDC088785 TaxID=3365897 RepID=UPI0038145395
MVTEPTEAKRSSSVSAAGTAPVSAAAPSSSYNCPHQSSSQDSCTFWDSRDR